VIQNVANIKWVSCLYDQGYLLTAVVKNLWRMCCSKCQGMLLVSGWKWSRNLPLLPCAHHLQGQWPCRWCVRTL